MNCPILSTCDHYLGSSHYETFHEILLINVFVSRLNGSWTAASIISFSICGAAISSILMYFCTAYKLAIVSMSINSLKIFMEN